MQPAKSSGVKTLLNLVALLFALSTYAADGIRVVAINPGPVETERLVMLRKEKIVPRGLLEKALATADRVYALVQGQVVLEAPTSESNLPQRLERAYFGHLAPSA